MRIFRAPHPPQGSHFLQSLLLPLTYTSFSALTVHLYFPLPPGIFIQLPILALLATIMASMTRRRRQQRWVTAYLWVISIIVLYLLCGLVYTGSLALNPILLLTWALSILQTATSSWFTHQLTGRARLWYHLRGLVGEELRNHARDFQEEANFTQANQSKLTGFFRVMTLWVSLSLVFLWGTSWYYLIPIPLILQINFEALYRFYRTEMELFSLGHRFLLGWTVGRIITALFLSFAALGLSLYLAGHLPYFSWGGTSKELPPAEIPPQPLPSLQTQPLNIMDFIPSWFKPMDNGVIVWLGNLFRQISFILVPIFLALLILVPAWLILRGIRLKPRAFRLFFVRRWYALINFFRVFWALLRRKPPPIPLSVEMTNREIWLAENKTEPAKGRKKSSNHPLIKDFLLLLDLGEELKVPYRRGSTTNEYLTLLAEKLSEVQQPISRLSNLLDAGFFRKTPLSFDEKKLWHRILPGVLDAGRKARHN